MKPEFPAVGRATRLLFALAMLACGRAPAGSAARPLVVASVRDLGALAKPDKVVGRDGGGSALIGGKILWTFGDTFWVGPAADGATYRTNTGALSDPAAPTLTTEPADATGAPFQFVPFTVEEQDYNRSTGKPDDRIALWPGSIVPLAGAGVVLVQKLHVRAAFNLEFLGIATAKVAAGSTVAVRDAGLLFGSADPHFHQALVDRDQLYLYGGLPGTQSYGVARAPLANLGDRSAYRFWNGSAWVEDSGATAAVLGGIPGGVTVSYNPYLGAYLAVHSRLLSSDVVLRTAPRPEGPWSDPVRAYTGLPPGSTGDFALDYAGAEHPELRSADGRTIVTSYSHPLAGFLAGEVRLVEVSFK